MTITYVENPHTMYVQAINQDSLEKFAVIASKLQEYCQNAQTLNGVLPDKCRVSHECVIIEHKCYRIRT